MLSPNCYSVVLRVRNGLPGRGTSPNKAARCSFLLAEVCTADGATGRGCQFGVPVIWEGAVVSSL